MFGNNSRFPYNFKGKQRLFYHIAVVIKAPTLKESVSHRSLLVSPAGGGGGCTFEEVWEAGLGRAKSWLLMWLHVSP